MKTRENDLFATRKLTTINPNRKAQTNLPMPQRFVIAEVDKNKKGVEDGSFVSFPFPLNNILKMVKPG